MSIPQVSPQDVHARMQQHAPDFVLLDCRDPDEVAFASVDGSVNIPMNELSDRLGELKKSAEIVVMCHHGVRAMAVAGFLSENGYECVASMSGGIHGWAETVDPDMPKY